MKEAQEKAAVLIEALPYIQRFSGKPVVIKFGGAAMENDDILRHVLLDVVLMEQVGMRPVVVHGGGPFISAEMERRGKTPRFVKGHRVTDEETLAIAFDVLVRGISAKLAALVEEHRGRARCVWDGGSPVKARKHYLEVKGEDGALQRIDLGLVGDVADIELDVFHRLFEERVIPIVPPVASSLDPGVERYNVQADTIACRLAIALGAEKLVFMSNTHGILADPDDPESFLSTVTEAEIERMIADGGISGGMLPKAQSALEALKAGVRKTHLIDGRIRHALLLEIFTDEGIGTQVVK